jgi:S1-C subfamily serine protease
MRIAAAVAKETGTLKKFVAAFGALVVLGVAGLVWLNQQQAGKFEALLAQGDSLNAALQRSLSDAGTRAAGFDSLQRELQRERDRLAGQLRSGGDQEQLRTQITALDRRASQALSLTSREISDANGKAVGFIIVEHPDGRRFSGTAFSITPSGLIVTNKHVVLDDQGRPPRRAGIQFADSKEFLELRFVSAAPRGDLAFLQLADAGTYPAVRGIASSDGLAQGDPLIMIGFPRGMTFGENSEAKTSLVAGAVSRMGDSTIVMNLYAAEGSSGSPVFDSRGYVVGVLFAGEDGTSSTMTHAVPGSLMLQALPPEGRSAVRQ